MSNVSVHLFPAITPWSEIFRNQKLIFEFNYLHKINNLISALSKAKQMYSSWIIIGRTGSKNSKNYDKYVDLLLSIHFWTSRYT